MKIAARGLAVGASVMLLALVSIAAPVRAQAPAKSLKDQLIGHWQLVSVTIDTRTPYGASPTGTMFLDAAGHFATIIISAGNARNIAYFGTYTVNDAANTLTIHIEGNSGGLGVNAAGRDETRLITLRGDELMVQSTAPSGGPGNVTLTWKQAN